VDASERKHVQEEQAKIEAIEAEKRAQEEEVLLQEAEIQRRKDTFEQIRQFAEDEPGATADILRSWVTTSGIEAGAEGEDVEKEADA
jgi:flagellar biosynthesis/type III secretory pathway M-ring protein FliF/YscJ